jgi:hypothetical protein
MQETNSKSSSPQQKKVLFYLIIGVSGILDILGMILVLNSDLLLGVASLVMGQVLLLSNLQRFKGQYKGSQKDYLSAIDMMRSRA